MKKTHGSNFSNKKGKLTSNEMGKQTELSNYKGEKNIYSTWSKHKSKENLKSKILINDYHK